MSPLSIQSSLARSLSLALSLSRSLSVSLSLCLSLSLSLSLSVSVCLSVCLSLSLPPSLSRGQQELQVCSRGPRSLLLAIDDKHTRRRIHVSIIECVIVRLLCDIRIR